MMLKPAETVVDYIVKEIKSCMSFMPIIYIESNDRMLIYHLLERKDCFAVFRRNDDGDIKPTEYLKYDQNINVIKIDASTDWKKIGKILHAWEQRPFYFIVTDFNTWDSYSQRKLIRGYVQSVFEEGTIPLKQNLILVSPVGMHVGDEEGDSVPSGFEQYVRVIDVPLMGIRDISEQVLSVQNKVLKQLSCPELSIEEYIMNPDSYIEEFKGMARAQVEYVLYELQNNLGIVSMRGVPDSLAKKIKSAELNGIAKDFIKKQKQQSLVRDGDIEYIDTDRIVTPGGMEGIEDWLRRKKIILDYPQRAKDYGVRFPKGILIAGLPGSGKSLMAKYVAKKFDLPLIQFKMDMVLQGVVGSSEQRIKQVLKLFEASAPCVIWIDEIEKEMAGMQGGGEADSGVNKRCLAKLLNWMQENEERCFVCATANRTDDLPQELLRRGRFDRLYYSFLPLEAQCVDILGKHILRLKDDAPLLFDASVFSDSVREMGYRLFDSISNQEHKFFTGSDIEGLVSDAKALMFEDLSRDLSNGGAYSIEDLEVCLFQAMKSTITYTESNYDEVLDYWIGLRTHQFHNVAVKEVEGGDDNNSKYTYMLFDFSDLQYDGASWNWRKGLKCFSRQQYDKNMFNQLTVSLKKRISSK